MKNILFLLPLALLFACRPGFEEEITIAEIEGHFTYLASDELKGRYPGTAEDQQLAEYLSAEFKKAGLQLYEKTGLQHFDIVSEIEAGPENLFQWDDVELSLGTDYSLFPFSHAGTVRGEVVFAGYGFQVDKEELKWDDYASLDVKGKWVMILRGVPGSQEATSPYMNYSEDRGKALLASDLGASGVIFLSGSSLDPDDQLVELKGKQHPLAIPVVHMSREAADRLLSSAGQDSLSRIDDRLSSSRQASSFHTGVEVNISVDLQPKKMETSNVIATLEGSHADLKDEYVLIGAHHDHLGLGGPESSSRAPDTLAVHYGADDNASGVAGVLEASEWLSAHTPARSVLFATFGAEEMGLIGSKYLAENPPVDMEKIQVMINLDMIGRLNEDRQLQVGGVGTSPGFKILLESINSNYGFNLKFANEGFGPSDHAAFYAKDVPVLFISTGAHSDYHTPDDQPAAINLEGTREVISFVSEIAAALANQHERVAFTEAGPKVRGSSKGRRGGITLGLMPDMTYDGSEGMPVMFVTEGRPAAVGGIQKGDVIVAIEGKSVGNVYDYMARLDGLKEGMSIVVQVKRDGDLIDLLIRI
ncbi:MAG: M20/M25/M40 family metallo-hydrolase [Bacteroidales bacterium]|nr:M20/M25/M40 family metallo-hydrolase [Bacteroidales bacterium]